MPRTAVLRSDYLQGSTITAIEEALSSRRVQNGRSNQDYCILLKP